MDLDLPASAMETIPLWIVTILEHILLMDQNLKRRKKMTITEDNIEVG
jgi:hypothetical protein